jgi:hypothetical protein
MITQTRWRESNEFEPWNPLQQVRTRYTGLPGGYSSFYYNQEPNITQLYGPDIGSLGTETVRVVPGAYGRRPGIYDRAQHLEVLNGALGMAPATAALLRFSAGLLVGVALGVAGNYAVRRIKGY